KRGHDPAPGAHILLGGAHAVEHVADGTHHGRPLLRRKEKAGPIEFGLEMREQSEQLLSRGRPRIGKGGALGGGSVKGRGAAESARRSPRLERFIAEPT